MAQKKYYNRPPKKNSKIFSVFAAACVIFFSMTVDFFTSDGFRKSAEAEAVSAPFTFTQNTAMSFGVYSHPSGSTGTSITLIAGGCTVAGGWSQLSGTCTAPNITIKDPNSVTDTICVALAKVSAGNSGYDIATFRFKYDTTTVNAASQCGLANPGTGGKVLIIRVTGSATTSVGDGANTMTYAVAVTYG